LQEECKPREATGKRGRPEGCVVETGKRGNKRNQQRGQEEKKIAREGKRGKRKNSEKATVGN